MLLSPDALHCLKRKQLTNLCRRFGIKAVGKNADLIQRLQEYAASNIPADSPTKGNVAILRHVKRRRQSDSSHESADDQHTIQEQPTLPYPPLTPRTRHKRVSDLVQAIEQVKEQDDDMDTDDDDEDNDDVNVEGRLSSQTNTIAFPKSSPASRHPILPPLPTDIPEEAQSTQPLRIIKALPSSSRIASPLSTETILEMSTPSAAKVGSTSSLYPDLATLPLPQGVSSECLVSSSTLPSITSRQFSAAAASVLAEMNARLTAAGRSVTSNSLASMSSMGNGTWNNLAASASSQGMSKSRSGRYEIHHERQFNKMDSIVNHYAARRVGAGLSEKSAADTSKSGQSGESASSNNSSSAVLATPRITASTSASRRARVDASTSTRSLAAMTRSTSARKTPAVQRRPLPVPPISQAKLPSSLGNSTSSQYTATSRQASSATTSTSNDPPRAKRLRLAVTEDQDALQNTVLEIPPEKKTVVIRVTRPDKEGMPYKFSVASSSSASKVDAPTRAASSLRKTVIKATKGTFAGSSSSSRKVAASVQSHKRETVFAKQQREQAVLSRSISSRHNLAAPIGDAGMSTSPSVRNKFTGLTNVSPASPGSAVLQLSSEHRKPSAAMSAMSGATAHTASKEASKHGSIGSSSSRFGGSIRSSVSQGLGRAEAARQARLNEIKARTKAALAGFGSQRNVSSATSNTTTSTTTDVTSPSVRKAGPTVQASFSPSVMKPTIASLNRSTAVAHASSSQPLLSQARPLSTALDSIANGGTNDNLVRRAATVHGSVGRTPPTPCLTPRSSSLRHLRRVMRKQQKQADLEQVRIAAAENIAPGAVVPSVVHHTKSDEQEHRPSIRTVASRSSPTKSMVERYATLPGKMQSTPGLRGMVRPAGPRAALVASRAVTSAALNHP